MALVIADRVQETTTTTGTGTVTLLGAVLGFQSFSVIGNANTTFYTIAGGSEWEVGLGTYTSSGTTLARTTVFDSSNAGSLVNFSAGTKNVFVTYPADRSISLDETGNLAQAVTVGLGTGRLPVEQVYRLNTARVGTNATGAQSFLGVGVTLAGSTVYQFEAVYAMNKTAGTTSYTMNALFGGTATLNNIAYSLSATADLSSYAPVAGPAGITQLYIQAATATAIRPASSAASLYLQWVFKGTVSVNAGGTFIPQYSLSAAPGGAFTMQTGSYFKISPLAASGANVNIGTWA
jgi:hypothetical protein